MDRVHTFGLETGDLLRVVAIAAEIEQPDIDATAAEAEADEPDSDCLITLRLSVSASALKDAMCDFALDGKRGCCPTGADEWAQGLRDGMMEVRVHEEMPERDDD